jgi:TRAP-type C4-dicarboxylate transport system permease small subunit
MNNTIYLLELESSITKLHSLLQTNYWAGKIKRTLSIIIECILVVISLVFISSSFLIPTDLLTHTQTISDTTSISGTIHNKDISALMMLLKFLIASAAVLPVLLLIALRKNRKKGKLIQDAFTEVENIKKKHEAFKNKNYTAN